MTRTSTTRPRPATKHRYRPQRVNLRELRPEPKEVPPPRVLYVQNPYYEQMECGLKTVESRPNYPCLRDLVPGTLVEFSNRFSGRSFLVTITSRRVHRDFATMLRAETIEACLPHHDPEDLQCAVNTYHSFRNGTYKFIARKHKVLSLRFTHIDKPKKKRSYTVREYDRNSLCSIFEAVKSGRKYHPYT